MPSSRASHKAKSLHEESPPIVGLLGLACPAGGKNQRDSQVRHEDSYVGEAAHITMAIKRQASMTIGIALSTIPLGIDLNSHDTSWEVSVPSIEVTGAAFAEGKVGWIIFSEEMGSTGPPGPGDQAE